MLKKIVMPKKIESEHITLVKRESKHSEGLYEVIDHNRDNLMEFLPWVKETNSVKDIKENSSVREKNWSDGKSFCYLIIENKTDKIIGSIDVISIDYKYHIAELGYWLDYAARGKGHMAEAVKLIEEKLFSEKIHRIEIRCEAVNVRSCRVADRAGYNLEGTMKDAKYRDDDYFDVNIYSKIDMKYKS